jgi:hypothetical protein
MRTTRRRLILPIAVGAVLLGGCTSVDVGTQPPPSAHAATDPPVIPSATASARPSESGLTDKRLFVHLIPSSAGMTVAVDSTGVIHVAAASGAGDDSLRYGRCAGGCDQASSWQIIQLPSKAAVSHVPTIALTDDDRPRILFASDLPGSDGFWYLECDSPCGPVGSWHPVRLTTETPSSNGVLNPRIPFSVSGDGGAAFAYDDGFGMYVWVCPSRCAAGTAWTRVTIADFKPDVRFYPEAVAFGSGQSLQVIARRTVGDNEALAVFDCPGHCTSGSNWAPLDQPPWITRGEQTMALARTAKGGTRILVYGDDPRTTATARTFTFLSCDTRCRNAASWKPPVAPPLAPDSANVGFALAVDDNGETVVATVSDTASILARCSRDCAGLTGKWQFAPGVSVDDMNAWLPPRVPASCSGASWGMFVGPGLALDPHGTPFVAFTAYAKGFGGECGTGSAATMSDSFLYASP